jgi:hypothetical protein
MKERKERVNCKEPGITPITKSYEELNERQQKFIDLVATGYHKKARNGVAAGDRMTLSAAYEMAGYTGKATKQAGWRLYMQTKHIIYKRRSEMVELNMSAVMASEIINELMQDKDQPGSVRLKAAQDTMMRTGFDKPQEIVLTKKVEDMSTEEVDAELEELLSGTRKPDTSTEATCH